MSDNRAAIAKLKTSYSETPVLVIDTEANPHAILNLVLGIRISSAFSAC